MSLKQENLSDKELVVGSIRILQNVKGAGFDKIIKKVDDLQKSTQSFLKKQNNYWKDLVQDGYINPIEKQTLYKEWQVIDRTYIAILQQATDDDVIHTDEIIAYKAAYERLKKYLFEDLRVFDNLYENTKITNREQFNEQYADYYEKEQFTQAVLATGMAGKPGHIRILDSLLGIGYVGEIAIFKGNLYRYDGTEWLEIEGSSYLGILNSTPEIETIGCYFLAGESNFIIPIRLSILAKDFVTKGIKYIVAKRKAEKGYIYVYEKTGWRKITNKDDYHYISAINDLLTLNEKLSPKLQFIFDTIYEKINYVETDIDRINEDLKNVKDDILLNNDAWQAAYNGVYNIIDGVIIDENGNPIDIDGKINAGTQGVLDVVDGKIVKVTQSIETIDGKILTVEKEVKDFDGKIEIINGDVTSLNGELVTLRTDLTDYGQKLTSYIADVKALEDKLYDQDGNIAKAIDGLLTVQDGIIYDAAGNQLFDISGQIKANENTILEVVDGKIVSVVEEKIDPITGEISTVKNKIVDIDGTLSATAGQIDMINVAVETIQNEIENIENDLDKKLEHVPTYLGPSDKIEPNAEIGDWYLYTGPTVTGTQSRKINVMYKKVDANIWQELDATDISNHKYYMTGLTDVLNNVKDLSDGYFNVIFAKALLANAATINALQSQLIKLTRAEDDTTGTRSGIIQSSNYDQEEQTGWKIDYNGNAEFNGTTIFTGNSVLRGNINIGGNAIFEGEIDSGPLYLTNKKPEAVPENLIFNKNEDLRRILSWYQKKVNYSGKYSVDGTNYINFTYFQIIEEILDMIQYVVSYTFIFDTKQYSVISEQGQGGLPVTIIFDIWDVGETKTLILRDLPTINPGQKNVVYVDGEGYLRISV